MKLNNKITTWTFALLLLLFCSCSDFLTRDHPTGVTDDDFWKTMNECESALGQCKAWPNGSYFTSNTVTNVAWIHMEGMTDNQYFRSNFQTEVVNLGNGSATPTSGGYISKLWDKYYEYIRRCNRFLEHVDNAYFTLEYERDRMKADVRVWRAWYHMQLLLWYGRHDGIPILEKALTPTENFMSRNTVEECLDFLNKEFDAIINITDDNVCPFIWDEGRRDRMSRSSALALKMDLNLQFQKYDIAKAAAKQLIDSGVFELYHTESTDNAPGKNYRDLFNYVGKQNKERIIFTSNGLNQFWFRCISMSLGGQGTCAVLKSFVDEFETIDGKTIQSLTANERTEYEKDPLHKERDPRLYITVMVPGDNTSFKNYTYTPFDINSSDYYTKTGAPASGYMLKKFASEQDRASGRGSLDFMLYRYAEVLLTYVECLVESGDWQNPDVEKYINMIRNRAGMPNMDKSVYNTQEKVRELYRRERRVELGFEGKRYDDIRRWNIGAQTMSGSIQGAWNPNTNSFVTIEERNCIFPKNDSWPLPQDEVTANSNISQPTGWK
ncbi:RagB/SusD family nutrient uptake outer membrane protein [Parabacteroides faecis]|uniref:RagB/SusD family nutrient uptake outer membrane protein n=1 Tax=Parabacteroides TaxID=375288 RepID=UPI000EFF1163|nr:MULTISPECIES: RagB/SusD family nutrient uptake outer membrane protein [Parabacteroides]MBC8616669.1 RagB/SusD family nutrient uptake outer membrane protein [Parabacteroides faecis]RHR94164.1 RagB/SusD family nutrient uptake outer membrane protein [Parabacteroides sp. AF14-59]